MTLTSTTTSTATTTTNAIPARHCHPHPILIRDALILLNNTAISLLQKGRYRCAIDTFKDALELLKSTTRPSHAATAIQISENRSADAAALIPGEMDSNNSSVVVVLSSQYDPERAYNLLSNLRTSKVCLTLDTGDATLTMPLIKALIVYNYGIGHRCVPATATMTTTGENGNNGSDNDTRLRTFCLQIFQYAEKLLPHDTENLLFRLVLTRNLMMLSCRLGMSLCEHYKETLDPIVADILGPLQPEDDPQGTPAA